jgi:putative membrane protein
MVKQQPLTVSERDRIEIAMAEAQKRTGARFSLIVVPISDHYSLYAPLWAAIGALIITGIAALVRPELGIRAGYVIGAASFVVLTFVFDWLPLRLRIVPERIKLSRAQQLAHREFAVHVVGPSNERNGVLFFVSMGERYVEVLADRDIHRQVGSQAWEKVVADFLVAARENRFAEGTLVAISALQALLEAHYPSAPTPQ